MRNRDASMRKLESLESDLTKLNHGLNSGNRPACYNIIENMQEKISQLKTYIESEPLTGSELNRQ